MGLAGPHDLGMAFIRQVLSESQKVWPGQGSRRPHQGPLGVRRRDGVGFVRTSAAPAGRGAGRPRSDPELRLPYVGTADLPATGTPDMTHSACSDTPPSRWALPVCKASRPVSFGNSAFGNPQHTTPHHTALHRTAPYPTEPPHPTPPHPTRPHCTAPHRPGPPCITPHHAATPQHTTRPTTPQPTPSHPAIPNLTTNSNTNTDRNRKQETQTQPHFMPETKDIARSTSPLLHNSHCARLATNCSGVWVYSSTFSTRTSKSKQTAAKTCKAAELKLMPHFNPRKTGEGGSCADTKMYNQQKAKKCQNVQ